jgi:hypothetical protein
VVDADADSAPLYETLWTETFDPLVVIVPFHSWVMVWPLPSVHPTVQALIAEVPAVTVTSPWNPPGHELTVR